jgi:histidine triad (HIT) family protein
VSILVAVLLQAAAPALTCPLDRPYDPTNPFARILRHEAPAATIVETRDMIAIVPIEWEYPGHALVIPRRAVRSLDDMTRTEMAHALQLARRIGAAQRRAFGATGYTVTQNNGRAQHVCHVHFHVIPNTPAAKTKATPAEMQAVADRLRAALDQAGTP